MTSKWGIVGFSCLNLEENPSLAKKLIQVLIQRGKKRSREELGNASDSSK